jgi:hypothetical protein
MSALLSAKTSLPMAYLTADVQSSECCEVVRTAMPPLRKGHADVYKRALQISEHHDRNATIMT